MASQSKTSLLSSGKKADRNEKTDNVLSKYNYGNGYGWRCRRDRKIANRGKGQTPGKTKGNLCVANSVQKYMAKTSRSYKHKLYRSWLEKTRRTAAK